MINVLITRFIRNRGYLKKLQEHKKIAFRECSFIDFEYKAPEEYPDTEWVFFTSANSVISFPDSFWQSDSHQYNIGATGKGTAKKLNDKLITPDFIGDVKKSTQAIAHDFYKYNNPSSVWFPISDSSKKTIQKEAPQHTNIVETIAYKTILKNISLMQTYNWYVFTSPSNVEGFFRTNRIPGNSNVLAIGTQTQKRLKDFCENKIYLPKESSEEGLLEFFSEL